MRKSRGTPLFIYEQMNMKIAKIESKKAERMMKRKANESVSDSESSFDEEEEFEDLSNINNNLDESELDEREATSPQLDPTEDRESPPSFRIRRPIS